VKANTFNKGRPVWDESLEERRKKATMTLNLPPEEMDMLEFLAKKKSTNKTEICRKALDLFMTLHIYEDRGAKLFVKEKDGNEYVELIVI